MSEELIAEEFYFPVASRGKLFVISLFTGIPAITLSLAPFAYVFKWSMFKQETPVVELFVGVGSILGSIFFGWQTALAFWRMIDNRFELYIDKRGIFFHPSVCRKCLSWTEIGSARMVSQMSKQVSFYREICFGLAATVYSLTYPLGTREIMFGKPFANDDALMGDAIRAIRHYRPELS